MIEECGQTEDGSRVYEIGLKLPSGTSASIITFGAIIRDLQIPARNGLQRVVLGYRDLAGYLADKAFVGAIMGRCANRIAGGRFRLDGIDYQLACNEAGRNHLHGGAGGFSRRLWSIAAQDTASVTLMRTSPAGEESYPGAVTVTCEYVLREPATLSVRLSAQADAPTIVNLAQHSYFTLAYGETSAAHWLRVNASRYTPFDEAQIPTGEIRSAAGTAYDFRTMRPIADAGLTGPLDMNFVLDRANAALSLAASVESPDRSLRLEAHTTEPGLQVYDGSYLQPSSPGLDSRPHFAKAGFCLEPQKFPDAINHPAFPSPVLRPGERYSQHTEYRFVRPGLDQTR
jgi:aldose 1-epimerase